jgi:hypothetical protein
MDEEFDGSEKLKSRIIQNLSYLIDQRISRTSTEPPRRTLREKPLMLVNEIENSVIRGLTIDANIARAISHGSAKEHPRLNMGLLLLADPREPRTK